MSTAKIHITIDDERVFYPGESITGVVRFEALTNFKVERINLQFLGFSRTCSQYEYKDLGESHDLVYMTKQLYPYVQKDEFADDNDDADDDIECLHSIDRGYVLEQKFVFKIPVTPTCSYNTAHSHDMKSPLPPTMRVKENSYTAEVEYSLVVSVDSPMRFKERIVEERVVTIGTSGTKEEIAKFKKREKMQSKRPHLLQTDVIPLRLNTAKSHFKRKIKTKLPVKDMNFRIVLMKPDELMVGGRLKSRVFLICYTPPDMFVNEYIDKEGVTTTSSNGLGILEIERIHMFVQSHSWVRTGVHSKNINHSHDLLSSTDPITIDLADLSPISKCYLQDYRLEVYYPGSYIMDISEFFPPLRVPESIPRLFNSCNIKLMSYNFELILDISSRSKVWTKMRCRLYITQTLA